MYIVYVVDGYIGVFAWLIRPAALGIRELLWGSFTCKYVSNCNVQWFLELILELVIIVHGLSVWSVPFLCGEQFSQNTALYTAYTINLLVYCFKGNVLTVIHTLSFMVMIYISFWDMFIQTCDVKYNAHMLNLFSCMLKFLVTQYVAYLEASCLICINLLSQGCNDCCHWQEFNTRYSVRHEFMESYRKGVFRQLQHIRKGALKSVTFFIISWFLLSLYSFL